MMKEKKHRAGFVNILGNPNVGKSTLMNALVGKKISIITSKAQTTRHRIMGIVNGEDFQIVYSDTPGIIKPAYKLQEMMMGFVREAISDADIFLLVTDVKEDHEKNAETIDKIKNTKVPVIVVINKIDLSSQEEVEKISEAWKKLLPEAEVIPASALNAFNLEKIFNTLTDLLPESAPYYPKDILTDKTERFIAAEVIREKIIRFYRQEIPYAVEIIVHSFKESEKLIKIFATIFVEKNSQKGIIIGEGGKMLKKVGIAARKDLEDFFDKQLYLELKVKVNKDWRSSDSELKRFGYKT